MNPENSKLHTIEYISYGLAATAVIIGLALVFNTDFISKAHDQKT